MRIQNCSNTPSLKHDDRVTNSVTCSPKRKRPNALKHGFYAGAPLIPGEDPDEFNNLYAELIDEWKPSGPTLRDGVFELEVETASPQKIHANEAKFNRLRTAQPCL
jgi:hypothetical protein